MAQQVGNHVISLANDILHENNCALLVMSCDAYDDLWQPFFTLLDRYWSDCPFSVYLGVEEKSWWDAKIIVLKSKAGGRNWSGRLIDYLQQLPHPYVLIMLDDFFLRSAVPTDKVVHCLEFARTQKAIQVRLIPRPGPTDRLSGEALIGECAVGLPYRVSTQAAIWNRLKLLELLRTSESIWEFEHNGNQRVSSYPHGFYSVWRPVLPYEGFFAHHVVEKGEWLLHEKWIFHRQKIGCDFTRRGTLPIGQTLFCHLASVVDRLLNIFPWRTKAKLKHQLKRLLARVMQGHLARMSGPSSKVPR